MSTAPHDEVGTALVLAGGKGSRLSPWPAPKCLLPVRGVSILNRIVHQLTPHVGKIVVCVGYRAHDVVAAVEDGRPRATPVVFSDAGEEATMGERLHRARAEHATAGRSVVVYGDELLDVSVNDVLRHHASEPDRAITFVACRETLSFGVVSADGRISSREQVLVNCGYAVVEPGAWERLRASDGLADWIDRVAASGKVGVYTHGGRRATVNSLYDLERAEEVWG